MSWVDRYARPYIEGEYDCWSLVREVYQRELGVDLPVVAVASYDLRALLEEFSSTPIRALFRCIPEPEHLCAVEMINRRTGMHVGVYLETVDGPRVLHNVKGSGVVCEPLETINRSMVFWKLNG